MNVRPEAVTGEPQIARSIAIDCVQFVSAINVLRKDQLDNGIAKSPFLDPLTDLLAPVRVVFHRNHLSASLRKKQR
jgi:hypothetical protein